MFDKFFSGAFGITFSILLTVLLGIVLCISSVLFLLYILLG